MCVSCTLSGKDPGACGSAHSPVQPLTIPGDISTTEQITIGGTIDAVLESVGDTDWFRIELTAGQTIQIDMFGLDHDTTNGLPELEDPFVRIYDASGAFLAENDDITLGVERDSRLIFTAQEDGVYFIEADAYTNGQLDFAGDYRLTVVETAAPPPPPPGGPVDSIQGQFGLDTSDPIKVFFALPGEVYQFNFGGAFSVQADGTNAYEQAQYFSVFEHLETFLDIDFEITTNRNEADLDIGTAALPSSGGGTLLGFFQLPSSNGRGGGGVINNSSFGYENAPGGSLDTGGFMYTTALHEFGHGLGLAHPHEAGFGTDRMRGVNSSSSLGDSELNQSVFTVMSYNEPWVTSPNGRPRTNDHGYNRTFGALDIAALQAIYGANTTHAAGDDRYSLWTENAQGTGYEALWDTGGADEIVHEGSAKAVIDLRAATLEYETGGGGFISYVDGVFGGFTIAKGTVIENASGGSGDDDITGNAAANRLKGGLGADTIKGGDGDDHLIGGAGADALNGGAGLDVADYAEAAAGVLLSLANGGTGGEANGDTFSAIENIIGTAFDDLLEGDGEANTITGGAGGDLLNGGAGADVLYGGEGFDALEGGAGADALFGGDGLGDIATYFNATGPLTFVFSETPGQFLPGSSAEILEDTIGDDIEGVAGSNNFSNTFDARALNSLTFLLGGAQSDTFQGGSGTDQLIGLGGNDVLYGNDGGDALIGEGGDDNLFGGAGVDVFFFGQGDGADVIHDLEVGVDRIFFTTPGLSSLADLAFSTLDADGGGTDNDTRITYDGGASVTILNVDEAAVQSAISL